MPKIAQVYPLSGSYPYIAVMDGLFDHCLQVPTDKSSKKGFREAVTIEQSFFLRALHLRQMRRRMESFRFRVMEGDHVESFAA